MWTIIKIDKKKYNLLQQDFKKKIGEKVIYYKPKMKISTFSKNRLIEKEIDILGNYVFCYSKIFKEKKIMNTLKFSKGLKYFLDGFNSVQDEINEFIDKCKKLENKNGFICSNMETYCENKEYEFISGPFAKKLFTILNLEKNRVKILLGTVETYISKNKYLFRSV